MKALTIRVSDEEHKLMQAVAARRFMSITSITRAHFSALFVEDGLTLDPVTEAKRALRVEVVQAEEQNPATPVYGTNEDGSINHRLRVAKARTLATEGMPKAQVAKAMGLTVEQIEASCIEVAKQGINGVLPWHSSEKAFALERMQSNPHYPVPEEA